MSIRSASVGPLTLIASTTRFAVLFALGILSGCTAQLGEATQGETTKVLTVRWQRLVDGGQTCERCGSTEKEIQEAVGTLENSLKQLGIQVILEKTSLAPQKFAEDTSQSNRIWIGDRTLEQWLGATVGKSDCACCCSSVGSKIECRTFVMDGQTYESIPAKLIVKAGLLAGANLLEASPGASCSPSGSCKSGVCGPSTGRKITSVFALSRHMVRTYSSDRGEMRQTRSAVWQ